VFDRDFFLTVLPEQVRALAASKPGQTPVLHLHVMGGPVYDICHLMALADEWLSAAYFAEPDDCDEVEIAFLPYNQIVRITVSLPEAAERPMGFNAEPQPLPLVPPTQAG
jgi:hypothetical protein